jgi:heat shock protein HspQ
MLQWRVAMDRSSECDRIAIMEILTARFQIGDIVRHRIYPFRGVIFDVDPEFANTDEWWDSIPEDVRPRKDQPYYHLLAENAETTYVAYVSEQNLLPDESGKPVVHPQVNEFFSGLSEGRYQQLPGQAN